MGGFLGIGQSKSEKADRANLAFGQQGLNSAFTYGMGAGQAGQQAGQAALQSPQQYFQSLLTPTRAGTAQNAAPATNAALAQNDAATRQAAAMGTGRSGGTAAIQRAAGTNTQANIDNIINQNLVTGQQTGAAGMTQIGSTELQNALSLMGIGTSAAGTSLQSAGQELQTDIQKENELGQAFGGLIGTYLGGGFSGIGKGGFSLSNPLGMKRS